MSRYDDLSTGDFLTDHIVIRGVLCTRVIGHDAALGTLFFNIFW